MINLSVLRKFFAILFFSFLIVPHLFAQSVPGYLGKHFMAGYNVNIGHNLFIADFFNNHDKARLTFRHSVNVEYISNRFTTLGAEISYINTAAGTHEIYNDTLLATRRFISASAGIFMKRYFGISDGLIAPIGNYAKSKIFLERMYFADTHRGNVSKVNHYWSPGIGVAFGQSRIIKNTVKLDAALEFDLLLGFFTPFADLFVKESPFYDKNEMAFYHLGSAATARIGISGLLF